MNQGLVARRYAKALFFHACNYGKEEQVYNETRIVRRAFELYPQIAPILVNPILSRNKKEEVIEALFEGKESDEFKNFIHFLLAQKREDFLLRICMVYQDLYRAEKKLLQVELTTASPADDATCQEVRKKMEAVTNQTVNLITAVNPELLGGDVLQWDTYRWDASLATRLRQIKRGLTEIK